MQTLDESKKSGARNAFVPECDEFGNYQPVQCYKDTNPWCWCVDTKSGSHIEGKAFQS